MKLPGSTTSGDTLLNEFGLYLYTRLSADQELRDLASRWDGTQGRLKTRLEVQHKAHTGAMIALAQRDGEQNLLSAAVRALYGTLVSKTNNNRKSPLFSTYFPEGLGAMVNAPVDQEALRVSVMVSKLGETQEPDLQAHLAPITAALDRLKASLVAYKSAAEAYSQAHGLVEHEKKAWFDAYIFEHRTLSQMFYQDAKKADSYFKPSPRGVRVKASHALAVAPPLPATAEKAATA